MSLYIVLLTRTTTIFRSKNDATTMTSVQTVSVRRHSSHKLHTNGVSLPGLTLEPPTIRSALQLRAPHGTSYPIGLSKNRTLFINKWLCSFRQQNALSLQMFRGKLDHIDVRLPEWRLWGSECLGCSCRFFKQAGLKYVDCVFLILFLLALC